VLSLRLVIFTALLGLALWALFSLLDALNEPALLRAENTVVVKGCDPIESPEAARLCPQLFCQKFLLDARALPHRSSFRVTVDTKSSADHLVGGVAGDQAASERHFACVLRDNKVMAGRLLDAAELDELAALPADWAL
jgi:hypothetical protein